MTHRPSGRGISGRHRSPFTLVAAFLAFLAVPTAETQGSGQISGRGPAVVDSANLDFAGQPVALYGLEGVPVSQTCAIGGQVWACGQEARWAAQNRVGNHWVVCVEQAQDDEGRILAVCYLGGVGGPELNAWLVEQGWALAGGLFLGGTPYRAQEEAARAAGRGLWRGR